MRRGGILEHAYDHAKVVDPVLEGSVGSAGGIKLHVTSRRPAQGTVDYCKVVEPRVHRCTPNVHAVNEAVGGAGYVCCQRNHGPVAFAVGALERR